ncbi:unnamed protein product [Caenorhabditis sp. 36 PRJEB53466]|nr:unnamed protein product [Caenorhabditis sp. 36 PRJEB53466]
MIKFVLLALLVVSTVNATNFCTKWQQIQPGDTCWKMIQGKINLTLDVLKTMNPGLNCDKLAVGQKLCMARTGLPLLCKKSQKIKPGDTCFNIWTANGLSEAEFKDWNEKVDCNKLEVGKSVSGIPQNSSFNQQDELSLVAEDPLCTRWQKNLSNFCFSKTTGYFKKYNYHQLNNSEYMANLNETSEEIIKCFHDLPCRTSRDTKMCSRIQAYRDTLFALTDSFATCSQKLAARNSECYFSWDPFLGVDEDGRILESFDRRDICKNYFGPKDCMRVEIVEYCTVEVWRSFKKVFRRSVEVVRTALCSRFSFDSPKLTLKLVADACVTNEVFKEMKGVFKLVAVCSVVFGAALGASVATADAKESKCTVADGFLALSCYLRAEDFVEKIDDLDMNDGKTVAEFKKSCDSMIKCAKALECESKKSESVNLVNKVTSYCNAVEFVADKFDECDKKLEQKNSTCYKDWDPFPAINEDGEKDETKAEEQKEACKNFFGKNNCLKKDIVDACGAAQWKDFKKHFLALNRAMDLCDFEKF